MRNKAGFVILHVMVALVLSHILYWGILKINYFITEKHVLWQAYYQSQIHQSMINQELKSLEKEGFENLQIDILQKLSTYHPSLPERTYYRRLEDEDQYGVLVLGFNSERVIIYHHQLFISETYLEDFQTNTHLFVNGIMQDNNITQAFPQEQQDQLNRLQIYLDFFLANDYQIQDQIYQEDLFFYQYQPTIDNKYVFDRGQVILQTEANKLNIIYENSPNFMRKEEVILPKFPYTIESHIIILEPINQDDSI